MKSIRQEDMILPVAGICCDRHEGQDFGFVFLVGRRTPAQPFLDGSAAVFVDPVRWIHVNRGKIPRIPESIMLGEPVFRLRMYNRKFVGTGIKCDVPAKKAPNGLDVLLRRPPFLAESVECAAGGHV